MDEVTMLRLREWERSLARAHRAYRRALRRGWPIELEIAFEEVQRIEGEINRLRDEEKTR